MHTKVFLFISSCYWYYHNSWIIMVNFSQHPKMLLNYRNSDPLNCKIMFPCSITDQFSKNEFFLWHFNFQIFKQIPNQIFVHFSASTCKAPYMHLFSEVEQKIFFLVLFGINLQFNWCKFSIIIFKIYIGTAHLGRIYEQYKHQSIKKNAIFNAQISLFWYKYGTDVKPIISSRLNDPDPNPLLMIVLVH